jgi:hypothetical protein
MGSKNLTLGDLAHRTLAARRFPAIVRGARTRVSSGGRLRRRKIEGDRDWATVANSRDREIIDAKPVMLIQPRPVAESVGRIVPAVN